MCGTCGGLWGVGGRERQKDGSKLLVGEGVGGQGGPGN